MHFPNLINIIQKTHEQTHSYALQQVNNALTIRNWLIGCYIVEYEQNGEDRAEYGEKLIENVAKALKTIESKGYSHIALRTNRTFYLSYSHFQQTVSVKLKNLSLGRIQQTLSVEFENGNRGTLSPESEKIEWQNFSTLSGISQTPPDEFKVHPESLSPDILLSRLSFSHFIELIKAETPLKRAFYEIQSIKNNWSVRELKRAMNTLLFERTGASSDKEAVIAKAKGSIPVLPADIIKNPYILEFLGLEEKPEYSESDLEQAIIGHLQKFLVEMGRGFCFEARQKRISFDNRHYSIDLVFYHRILKCHVLVDLKLGEFDHADAGQMNLYLNYFKENEITPGDNPPVGIILCAQKNDALVKYATGGMTQEVFVGKYMVQLPSVEELKQLVEADIREMK